MLATPSLATEDGASFSGHEGRVVPVAFSFDGRRFVAEDLAGGLADTVGSCERAREVEERNGTRARHLAVRATFLATIADERGRAARTIDVWDPMTFRALGSIDLPDDAAPTWMVASRGNRGARRQS